MRFHDRLESEKKPIPSGIRNSGLFDTLSTIANLKIWLVLLVLLLVTISLYVIDAWLRVPDAVSTQWAWLRLIPWQSLAGVCLGSAIVAFAYEWLIRKETEGKLEKVLERYFNEQKESIGNEIPKALLTNAEIMKRVLAPEIVDNVIKEGLEARLGDAQLAKEAYENLLSHMLTFKERRSNYRCKIYLAPIKGENFAAEVIQKYYQGYIDVRYDTILQKDSFSFTCSSSMTEYNDLLREPNWELRWEAELTKDFPKLDESLFDVESVEVEGFQLKISRQIVDQKFVIVADHPELKAMFGKSVKVFYRYKVKLQKRGHLLIIHIPCPTHKVVIDLDYADTDIRYINVLDFFMSKTKPAIQHIPSKQKPHRIEVEVNEWVFPRSGMVFGWVLRSEMTPNFLKLMMEESHRDVH